MKGQRFILVLAGIIGISITGCSESTGPVVYPPSGGQLITNSSFELYGFPSLQGWNANTSDTSYIGFSTDTPPQGGRFSVRLRNAWSPSGRIWWKTAAVSGIHRYRLSVWAKAIARTNTYAGGWLGLYQRDPSGTLAPRKLIHLVDTTWTNASLVDTVNTITINDTVAVVLFGNEDQWSSGYVLFDLVTLERLD